MKVNIKCFATLSKEHVCDYHGSKPYELNEGATVKDLVKKLEVETEEVKIIFVNHKEVELDHVLSDGDQVALAPKSGGM
jgi:molybdopterin converting factor small subunit